MIKSTEFSKLGKSIKAVSSGDGFNISQLQEKASGARRISEQNKTTFILLI